MKSECNEKTFIFNKNSLSATSLIRSRVNYLEIHKYINPTLLIIDEWLLIPPTENEVKLIFEVIHKRRKKSSTIFCSQFQDDGWYERLGGGDNPISDAIMDRIQYDAYRINIVPSDPANDRSMREVYGIKSLSDGK